MLHRLQSAILSIAMRQAMVARHAPAYLPCFCLACMIRYPTQEQPEVASAQHRCCASLAMGISSQSKCSLVILDITEIALQADSYSSFLGRQSCRRSSTASSSPKGCTLWLMSWRRQCAGTLGPMRCKAEMQRQKSTLCAFSAHYLKSFPAWLKGTWSSAETIWHLRHRPAAPLPARWTARHRCPSTIARI